MVSGNHNVPAGRQRDCQPRQTGIIAAAAVAEQYQGKFSMCKWCIRQCVKSLKDKVIPLSLWTFLAAAGVKDTYLQLTLLLVILLDNLLTPDGRPQPGKAIDNSSMVKRRRILFTPRRYKA